MTLPSPMKKKAEFFSQLIFTYWLLVVSKKKNGEQQSTLWVLTAFFIGKKMLKLCDFLKLTMRYCWVNYIFFFFNTIYLSNTMQLLPHFSHLLPPKSNLSFSWGCPAEQIVWRKKCDSSLNSFSYGSLPQVPLKQGPLKQHPELTPKITWKRMTEITSITCCIEARKFLSPRIIAFLLFILLPS